jgi:hypothetical protein
MFIHHKKDRTWNLWIFRIVLFPRELASKIRSSMPEIRGEKLRCLVLPFFGNVLLRVQWLANLYKLLIPSDVTVTLQ